MRTDPRAPTMQIKSRCRAELDPSSAMARMRCRQPLPQQIQTCCTWISLTCGMEAYLARSIYFIVSIYTFSTTRAMDNPFGCLVSTALDHH